MPALLLSKDEDVDCRLVMIPGGCGNRRDYWPSRARAQNGKFVAGGFYAPYVLDRYTSGADPSRRSTIYWLLSTWNPYEVTVMRTTFEHNSR
ncbi:MAG TPA: hypothetical protein VGI22_25780 [Xanthobacteraceae bacterium]